MTPAWLVLVGSVAVSVAIGCATPAPRAPAATPPRIEKQLVVAPLPSTPARLPHTFEPTSYAARLHVDPAQPGFSATIAIDGELAEPSALIWLNAEDLVIHRATASRAGSQVPLRATLPAKGWLALQSEQPLAAGAWTLSITYSGAWNDARAEGGFVQTHAARNYVVTQFQPDYARRVFPCFDEPDRKVPWQVTLDVPDAFVAATNTPIEYETRNGAGTTKTVRFAPTKPIPSYLVAFAVGPFATLDAGTTKSGIPIRVLALHDQASAAAHAVSSAPQLVDRIESWLGVPFPYPKLDLVTVPSTARWWLAMENPGLVTFHSELLKSPSEWDEVMTHEIAHHWFGDYVTPAAWHDIWLNESFAYWISDRFASTRAFEPWRVTHLPIALEELANPRAELGSDTSNRGAAAATVDKGRRFLQLLERALGPEALVRALRAYLTAHPYGTVRTSDLRKALEQVGGASIASAFDRYAHADTGVEVGIELRCTRKDHRIAVTGFGTIGVFCFSYDHDGTRRDRCATLTSDAPTLELGTKRCPKWWLSRSLHTSRSDVSQLEAVRDHGWTALSTDEQRELVTSVVLHDPSKGRLRWSLIAKAASSAELATASWIARYLWSVEHQIPPALRAPYHAWIRKHFRAQARKVDIGSLVVAPDRRERESIVYLAISAGEPHLLREATALEPRLAKLDGSTRALVVRAAVRHNPAAADALVAELATASQDRAAEIAWALEVVPDLLAFMQKHVKELAALPESERKRLFGLLCDENRRADVEALGRALFAKWDAFAMRDFEWCITERKALEPELRALLRTKP